MRKKNHFRRNSNGGKFSRKTEINKVKKGEIDVILKIQNLINEEINKAPNLIGCNTFPDFNCGSDQSEINDIIALTDDDDENDNDNFEITVESSEINNTQVFYETLPILEKENVTSLMNKPKENVTDWMNKPKENANDWINKPKENVTSLMNKPLLSLCNTAKVSKPIAQEANDHPLDNSTFECLFCPSKYLRYWNLERHMKKKHPNHDNVIKQIKYYANR